jgi:hypothetical protein
MPARLKAMAKIEPTGRASASASARSGAPKIDPRFAPVVAAFARDGAVTTGGKGFGSTGLKVWGKLFAMISSRGQFVAKLPKARVSQLVQTGQGEPFDPGHGRLMKEWIAMGGTSGSWIELAKEARRFVGGGDR